MITGNAENLIWTEKYRPKTLGEVVGQDTIVKRLQHFVKNKNMPHCLFAGPAGSGKSTAAMCISRDLYGSSWKGNFLELNASDERGIDTVRVKVKEFARTVSMSSAYKIIFLDEADALTRDAQHALRRTMEKYSDGARFILSVNYIGRIIAPIQSRTAVFRFSPLGEKDITEFLQKIAKSEKLAVDKDALSSIFHLSYGDMRKAVNILQTASTVGKVTKDTVLNVTNSPDPDHVKKMLTDALDGKFLDARSALRSLLTDRGLAGEDIIREIHNQIFALSIDDRKKIALLEKLGEYEFRITEGSNPLIQLEALLAQFMLVGK